MNILLEQPRILPADIVCCGVTERNTESFPPYGFSPLKAQILTETESEQHRTALASRLGISRMALRFQQQVHGSAVQVIGAKRETNIDETNIYAPFAESDALMTNVPGVMLCIGIADCAAVLLFDPVRRAVAGIHSGWRGTTVNIVKHSIEQMQRQYGTEASSLLAYISPCASGERYILREDVVRHFPTSSAVRQISDVEYTFDNRAEIASQLRECGVKTNQTEIAPGCTIAETRYHSHRRDGALAGRMVAVIGLW
jgi:polyphenol oxidase